MPTPDPQSSPPAFDRARFWRLLARYFIGVAIGCMLVGMILNAKRQYLAPEAPAPGSPVGEPTPASPSK